MKIVLLSFPAFFFRYMSHGIVPPLGLAYIASSLEEGGHEVKIIDLVARKMSDEQFQDLIRSGGANLYGLSCTHFGLREAQRLTGIIKRHKPDSMIVLGGHCVFLGSEILLKQLPDVDIVVLDEGEDIMLELCQVLEGGKALPEVRGISYRAQGKIVTIPPRPGIKNLDDNPFPARHLLSKGHYRLHPPYGSCSPFQFTLMEASRGCTSRCIFCAFAGRPYRSRSPKNVVDEMELIIKEHGIKEIYFVDPTFNAFKGRNEAICDEIIRRGIDVAWTCKLRVDLVSKEALRKMKEAGCYMISYGVESGVQRILDNLKKGTTVEQIRKAFRLTREAGIRSIAYLMVGAPGESEESVQATVKLVREIEPDFVIYSVVGPVPSSELYRDVIKQGILTKDYYEKLLFSDGSFKTSLYTTPEFGEKEIIKWIKKATVDFYFRPKYWLRRLRNIKNINDAKNMVRGFSRFILDSIITKKDTVRH